MRILLCIHHYLNPDQGAPGVTLAIGQALEQLGCQVEYYGFDHAFLGTNPDEIRCSLQYPWKLSAFLSRYASAFDVIDVSTGDAWVWATLGRPGAKRPHVLVTRSHGLEHVVVQHQKKFSKETRQPLSWKYPFYHAGYRLWEVERSLQLSDCSIMLNETDNQFAVKNLCVSEQKCRVLPHAISDIFHGASAVSSVASDTALRLAFVGTWLPRKGNDIIISAVSQLGFMGVPFLLSLYGTGVDTDTVLKAFAPKIGKSVRVLPHYSAANLPGLLAEEQVLLFPSRSEGFGLALLEAMACGLAPITTPVGIAPTVIKEGINGHLVPIGNASSLMQAANELNADRIRLQRMRQNAQASVSRYKWDNIGAETLALYNSVLHEKKPQ